MAKQTFTTGQVLTAAQMTSLQQTAMGGGSATAKTASYVLVAADAGGTVAMNAAGATTITVNTGLFAAGDTVFIQNLGAGACTVTAGTATVATAGSLILPQNDAGILYFTATGASIFYDYIQTGAASPLTTKGDLYTFSTSDARLAVGTNTHVLTADSAEATGLKWAAPAAGMTQMGTTTTLSGSSTTITIDAGYNNVQVVLRDIGLTASGHLIQCRFNSDTGSNYFQTIYYGSGTTAGSEVTTTTGMRLTASPVSSNTNADATFIVNIYDYLNTASKRIITYQGNYVAAGGSDQTASNGVCGYLTVGTAISSITILTSGTLVGSALVYGVK